MKSFLRYAIAALFLVATPAHAVKISALSAGSALTGTEVAAFVQSGTTVKITADQIKTFVLTPWTSDIDANDFDLREVNVLFVSDGSTEQVLDVGNDSAITPAFQVSHTTAAGSAVGVTRFSTAGEARIMCGRSRGATVGSFTIINNGDNLCEISAQGADGSDMAMGAKIKFIVDNVPGNGDMPVSIVFATTANNANDTTDRVIINSAGQMTPAANDGIALGTGTLAFADLFLANGGVININNNELSLTHLGSDLVSVQGGSFGVHFQTGSAIAAGVGPFSRQHYNLGTESSAASDDLDTITAPPAGGVPYWLQAENDSETINVTSAGNIAAYPGKNCTLDDDEDIAHLQYNSTTTKWHIINCNDGYNKRAGEQVMTMLAGSGSLPSGGAIAACGMVAAFDSGSNDVFLRHCLFTAATDNALYFLFVPPKSADESVDLQARISWIGDTGTDGSDDVIWTAACVAFGSGDDTNGNAFPTVDTVTDTYTNAAVNRLEIAGRITTLTPAGTWTEGDTLVCRITRDADAGGDTYNGSALLTSVDFYYQDNAPNEN